MSALRGAWRLKLRMTHDLVSNVAPALCYTIWHLRTLIQVLSSQTSNTSSEICKGKSHKSCFHACLHYFNGFILVDFSRQFSHARHEVTLIESSHCDLVSFEAHMLTSLLNLLSCCKIIVHHCESPVIQFSICTHNK